MACGATTHPPSTYPLPYLTLPVGAFPSPSLGAGGRDGRLRCYCGWEGSEMTVMMMMMMTVMMVMVMMEVNGYCVHVRKPRREEEGILRAGMWG
jgi:hypothetical protein